MRVAAGALAPGELIVFVSYTRKAHNPLQQHRPRDDQDRGGDGEGRARRRAARRRRDARGAARRLPRRPRGAATSRSTTSRSPTRGDRPALRDVSLRIAAGERVAVMGPSGAGQVDARRRSIARFYDPTAGRVLIDGRDARDCSLAWLREQVAIVLQDTVLFTGSVRENIAYGARRDARGRSSAAARAAAAHDFIARAARRLRHRARPAGRRPLRAASASASASPARCCATRRSCCSTSRRPGSTPTARRSCSTGLRALMAGPHDACSITPLARACAAHGRPRSSGSTGGRIARARRGAPDRALPQLERLLDPDGDARRARRSLRGGADARRARRRAAWSTSRASCVAVALPRRVGGAQHDAVATSIAGHRPRRARAASRATPSWRAASTAARRRRARSPTTATSARSSPGCRSTRGCPRSPSRRAELAAPAASRRAPTAEPELLGYKPRARAVLRAGRRTSSRPTGASASSTRRSPAC